MGTLSSVLRLRSTPHSFGIDTPNILYKIVYIRRTISVCIVEPPTPKSSFKPLTMLYSLNIMPVLRCSVWLFHRRCRCVVGSMPATRLLLYTLKPMAAGIHIEPYYKTPYTLHIVHEHWASSQHKEVRHTSI